MSGDAKREPVKISYVGTVSSEGDKKLLVIIPKQYHEKAKPLQRKHVKVTIEEILV